MRAIHSIIYIGEEFYMKSGSMMSSIYEVVGDIFERSDWGKIKMQLESGDDVTIRQATPDVKVKFYKKLLEQLNDKR